MKTQHIVIFMFSVLLAACGGGGGEDNDGSGRVTNPPPPAPQPPRGQSQPPRPASHGHFLGTVRIGGTDFLGRGLLTVEGEIRLYLYDLAQLVGTVDVSADRTTASGSGIVIGQDCSTANPNRFCNETAASEISLRFHGTTLGGDIRLTVGGQEEVWSLWMDAFESFYTVHALPGDLAGQFEEFAAEFSKPGDTIWNIDNQGRLFFQSIGSGCIGNGTVLPHGDGKFSVYDIELTLANCAPPYDGLNGEFEGLGTTSPGSFWDYDSYIFMWLSRPAGAASQAALRMWGILH